MLRIWRAEANEFDMKLFNSGNYMRAIEQKAMAETGIPVNVRGEALTLAEFADLANAFNKLR